MSNPFSIPLSSIIEGSRSRKDYGDLSGLKDSLKRIGSIHPIVLSKRGREINPANADLGPESFDLIAGGRRFRAMQQLKITELHHASVLNPEKLGFLFRDEVPLDELREAELDENLYRLKPKWQEDCILIYEVHALKRKKHGAHKWGQRQTAELLSKGGKKGFEKSSVNLNLVVAELLLKGDKEILACESLGEANALRLQRCEEGALAEMQKRVMPQSKKEPTSSTSTFLDSFNLKGGDKTCNIENLVQNKTTNSNVAVSSGGDKVQSSVPSIQTGPKATEPPVQVPLSQMFWNMDFRDWWRDGDYIPSSFNHIVTDIPYGIDMDNLNKKQVKDVLVEHEVEANIDLMKPFLEFAWDVIKPHGFCVFSYDLDHHEKLQHWAQDVGFKVQSWPVILHKTSSCQNNAAQYNTTKNYECLMYLRKDSHTILRRVVTSSVRSYDFSAERRLYNNPFAKPFDLWKDIFDDIAFPGQTILDPFCGEMSSCRAAANCGLVPYGIEINEKHYNRGLENMRKTFAVIHKSNVIFT